MSNTDILLVEDNMGDVILFKRAVEAAGAPHTVKVVQDGVSALEYLRTCADDPETCPGLMVLDLNLPRMGGSEVIQCLCGNPSLRTLPLVVLTSSQHEKGVLDAWDPDRCLYLVKPTSFRELVDLVRHMLERLKAMHRMA